MDIVIFVKLCIDNVKSYRVVSRTENNCISVNNRCVLEVNDMLLIPAALTAVNFDFQTQFAVGENKFIKNEIAGSADNGLASVVVFTADYNSHKTRVEITAYVEGDAAEIAVRNADRSVDDIRARDGNLNMISVNFIFSSITVKTVCTEGNPAVIVGEYADGSE